MQAIEPAAPIAGACVGRVEGDHSQRICADIVRAAVIGNAGTLIIFRVGGTDDKLLVSEFRSMEVGALADQEPFTAWLKRGTGHHRIFVEPKAYGSFGTFEAIRRQSRERFGRHRLVVESGSRTF
jgi:hypothetical protein